MEKALTREELLEENYDESKNQSGRFTFGSDGTNQGGVTNPAFIFGGSKQTSNPSSGVPVTFGSLKPGGLESEQQSEEIDVKNHSLNDNAPDEEANDTAGDIVEKALTREELLEEQYDESKNQSGGTEASPNLHENPEGITCDETPLVLVKEEVETLITPVVTRNEDSVSSGTEASPNLHENPEGMSVNEEVNEDNV